MFGLKKAQSIYVCLLATTMLPLGCNNTSAPPTSGQKPVFKTWTNSIGMKLIHLPSGSFQMGDARPGLDAQPVHQVLLSSFWVGQFEVTNVEFDLFKRRPRFPESLTNLQPAMRVSYPEAVKFCEWLSKKENRRYRLPTEAEWEYAARGGLNQKDYPWGNEGPEGRATFGLQLNTTPIGTYAPNGFGLYDMAGNVEELVSDWYDENYYARSPKLNPTGPAHGRWKVTRGGFFGMNELYCAERAAFPLDTPSLSGFRIVMEFEKNKTASEKVQKASERH